MNLTNYEKNVLLVSLDHMEEHLEEIEYNGVISEDTYNLRMDAIKTARTKIQQEMGFKYEWNEDTVNHFKFESSYIGRNFIYQSIVEFIDVECQLEDGDDEDEMAEDLMNKVFKN